MSIPPSILFFETTPSVSNRIKYIEQTCLFYRKYGNRSVLALVVVTVANLGKLFSEAVENVDSGPLEAIEATGAGRLQTIVYGVVPQVVPPFLAFGIYHWDINVRISTVIGFVGGGGIGFVLREWMNQLQWGWASVAVIGIVVVVASMDALSVRLRERLV